MFNRISQLCDDLEGWGFGGGRWGVCGTLGGGQQGLKREDICILIPDSHCCTAETQHCKAVILQLEKLKKSCDL